MNTMQISDKEMREIFHLLFLEQLLRVSDPKLFILKGGVNLRFFLQSPRYSEDMDIDVTGGAVQTLKKNAYKILESPTFLRALRTYGIVEVKINDPAKAKQTETTQRFRVRLINQAGEEFATKIEFSRRETKDQFLNENVDAALTAHYKRISFRCQHYSGAQAVAQKIRALAGRPETQARDIFDLYLLHLSGFTKEIKDSVSTKTISSAQENALTITFHQYRDQVEEYLTFEGQKSYGGKKNWNVIQDEIIELLS